MRGARPERALDAVVRSAVRWERGVRVLLACSGGPDSVALAALLDRLARADGFELILAHVNHGTRPSADQDECVVLSVAARLGRPVRIARLPAGPADEASLRGARYAALAGLAAELGAAAVVTAHTAEDQTETVLLALFRGTGLRGLAGMPVRRPLAGGLELVRPLLRVTHAELATELRRSGLPYALDPTNASARYRRNALRPPLAALRAEFPGLDRAVARCAAIVRDDLAGSDRARARHALRARLRARDALRDVTFARVEAALDARRRTGPMQQTLPPGIERVLISAEEIAAANRRIAAEIARDYAGRAIVLVGVLKGAVFATADLARALSEVPDGPSDIQLDFIAVSSYGNAHRSSGEVRLIQDTTHAIEGKHVIIVEDIVDNGHTLHYLRAMLGNRQPASLRAAVLLDKPYHRALDVTVDYAGLTCPDEFVVGYGLDYQERYRTLPYIAKLRPEVLPA